ncbi:SPOR domain-containing protein [Flexistipes sp.]|uniref:SPOR domain-containing protein n=1 Tax=Flexistipes sp. TaxID=3088135 RepID=UPI002E1C91D8|nr:SPOR domain-containing protein [Flexistipes sp.]
MKDFDKIKEKKNSDDMRGIIVLSIIFLIAFALIVFAIIKLTNDYFDLKMKLKEAKQEDKVHLTDPGKGKSYQFTAEDNGSIIKKTEKELQELSKMDISDDNATVRKEKRQTNKEEKVTSKPVEKKEATGDKESTAKEAESAAISKSAGEKEKGDFVVQILSVQSKADAKREAQKLRKLVSDVYVARADLGSKGIWYRVRCCKNTSKKYATDIVNKIKSETRYKPIVLRSD